MGKVTKKKLKEHFVKKHPDISIKDIARNNAQTDKIRQATEHFLVLKIIGEAPETELFLKENKKSKQPLKHLKMFKDRTCRVYVKLFQKAMLMNQQAFNGKCMITSSDITTALSKSKWLYEEALMRSEAERLIGFIKEKKEERIVFKALKNDFLSLMPPQQQVSMVEIPRLSEMTVIGQKEILRRS
jgi:hypothetical protein